MVERYNYDDCASALGLRNWLEEIRAKLIEEGMHIDRPTGHGGAPSVAVSEWEEKVNQLGERLTADVPVDLDKRNDEQQGRWLLANLLDWYRREEKAVWWEYFRLRDLTANELLDEQPVWSVWT